MEKLPESREVMNVDGTPNRGGKISRFANLTFTHQGKTFSLPFFVTNLGRDCIILGIPWFQEFEPQIHWGKGSIKGDIRAYTKTKLAQINATTLVSEWAIAAKHTKT
jgi:hypothetical protein